MNILTLLSDYTFRTVMLGSALLGIVSGVLGCFAVLRRQGLLGDAMAHATLPGICLAFLFTGSKAPLVLLIGAVLAGWLGMLALLNIVRHSRISEDSALGIVLSVFFAFGILLLTFISKRNDANQSGLDKFLFGQAAALVEADIAAMFIMGLLAIGIVLLFYKEFKLITFDAQFAASLGLPSHWLGVALTTLIVIAVVIGLKTVGVVLMASMLIGPAVAARQWTNQLGRMIALAGLFGALAGVLGTAISVSSDGLPTGPMVILSLTAIVLFSIIFAPERGVLWDALRRRVVQRS